MSFVCILIAFALGFVARQFTLPPLVGYLAAGFILHALGYESDNTLQALADFGITLMLFTIGLKVNLKELMRVDIWSTTGVSMALWIILFTPLLIALAAVSSYALFDFSLETAALVAFALSFSSTVCVIKILEDNSELKTRHSDLAISVLIIQDLIAVGFLFVATGKVPSIWSLGLIPLVFCRPLIARVYAFAGHGELVPLSGIMLALGGYALFEALSLKGDLGALAAGMLLAGLPKTAEVYKSLISFKDIFLIGFFLSIGFTATPTLEMWGIALALLLLLPFKFLLFFWIITRFSFRARTAMLSALLLSNFSEFGLIVASLALDYGWLSKEWLVVIALSTAMSFLLSSLSYKYSHRLFTQYKHLLLRFEKVQENPVAQNAPKGVEILIVGMGRVGTGAYKELENDGFTSLWGIEVDRERAAKLAETGMRVIAGDADDIEFWERQDFSSLKLVMLALPSTTEMKNILEQLKAAGYQGKISVIARYEDEQKELMELGADVAFNYYFEVGTGFAEESKRLLQA